MRMSILSRFFPGNRRDGARMLSSAILILTIALTQLHHFWGQLVSALTLTICFYWGLVYRRLDY